MQTPWAITRWAGRGGILSLAATVSLCASGLSAQQPRQLTAADYQRAERFLPQATIPLVSGAAAGFRWLADGRVWYRATTPGGFEFRIADAGRRTAAAAFDHARLATSLSTAMGMSWEPTRLPPVELSPDGRLVTLDAAGRTFSCNLQTYACAAAPEVAAGGPGFDAPDNSVESPDGRYAAFVREHDLWVKDLTTDQDRPLTTDGVEHHGYATNNAGWIRSPEPVLLWSPDSRKIATFQHDARGTSDMYLITTNVGAPQLDAWKYPLPGDSVIFRIERVIIEVEPTRVVRLRMPPDPHRSSISDHVAEGSLFLDVQWYPDASRLAFVSSSRDHKVATLRVADAATGEVRTVLEERSPTQFQSAPYSGTGNVNWRVLPASNEVIWWSQRANWGHLYLYDLTTGTLKNQITTGDWNVNEIERLDERSRTLFLAGQGREAGRDPYFVHFYRVGMDGRGLTLLTPDDATHSVTLSPDGRQLVDVFSTPTAPTRTVLRRLDRTGDPLELARLDISRLTAAGWKPPTPITVKARDGMTDVYGLMWTPTTLDSTRTYPIVNYIYPGPWGSSVPTRTFQPSLGDFQSLAELGFVVVAIDNMGTEGRSKAFHDAYYGNMGDNGLADQVAGMRDLARRYSFIDLERAGIWGHSGGGFAAAGAMFRYPDFFKVGISESGNHDNRNYEDDWGERFHGQLTRNARGDSYDSQANHLIAGNLQGKLLLAHGGMDDNVPPSNTYLVVDALIKANKDFDLIIFPNQSHGYGEDDDYMTRRRWDYFVKHLLGAEPPAQYRIGG